MKVRKFYISFVLFIAIQTVSNAQSVEPKSSYQTAIGIRAGVTSGITIKHFFSDKNAFEGIAGFWRNGLSTTFLYERHESAFSVPGLRWYFGGGAHFKYSPGYYSRYDRYDWHYHPGSTATGIVGIGGIEYKFNQVPIAINMDIKPYFEINELYEIISVVDPGIGIKITF